MAEKKVAQDRLSRAGSKKNTMQRRMTLAPSQFNAGGETESCSASKTSTFGKAPLSFGLRNRGKKETAQHLNFSDNQFEDLCFDVAKRIIKND